MGVIYDAIKQLKKHEGLRLKPYRCTANKLTIAYGRNLEDVGITESEAEGMLEHDVSMAYSDLEGLFDDFAIFSTVRQVALIDMRFNLGASGFRKFAKMIEAINNGNWLLAAEEAIDSKWYTQVGHRAITIANQLKDDQRWY